MKDRKYKAEPVKKADTWRALQRHVIRIRKVKAGGSSKEKLNVKHGDDIDLCNFSPGR